MLHRYGKSPNGSESCVTDLTLHTPIRQSIEICKRVLLWKHKMEQNHTSASIIMLTKRRARRVYPAAQPAWCLPAQSISCQDDAIKRRPNATVSRDGGVLGQREGNSIGTEVSVCQEALQICGADCLL